MYTPDLKYHDGYFYLLNSRYSCGGIFIMRSRNPAGPWPDPTWLPLKGIDPSIFFDDDGRAYVLHNDLPPGKEGWDGHRAIWLQEIDLKTLRLVGEHVLLADGGTHPPEHPFWIEGPHLFKKGGVYYLICAQGSTNEQHVEVAFRSRTLRGPYEARPDPILTQVGLDPSRANRVANAGHADMVTTPNGN